MHIMSRNTPTVANVRAAHPDALARAFTDTLVQFAATAPTTKD